MGDKPKDEETPEPKSAVDKLIEKADVLIELRTQEHLKAQEKPGPTDPATRPDFSAPTGTEIVAESAQDKRFLPYREAKLFTSGAGLGTSPLPRGGETGSGLLPHPLNSLQEDERRSYEVNVSSCPRGDFENFSMARYAMAKQRNHYLGDPIGKSAPWEHNFYDWARKIMVHDPVTKAQGDMVSGSIPGRAV